MDRCSWVLALVLMVSTWIGVSGLTCYSCIELRSNTKCGEYTETYNNDDGKVCYKIVEHLHDIHVLYSKGVMTSSVCELMERINKGCGQVPSHCVYCCRGDLCNQSTMSSVSYHLLLVAFLTFLLKHC